MKSALNDILRPRRYKEFCDKRLTDEVVGLSWVVSTHGLAVPVGRLLWSIRVSIEMAVSE